MSDLTRQLTLEKKKNFIRTLAETGQVKLAARAIGASREGCYNARKLDPEFAEAWDDAKKLAAEQLEDEGFQRALGWHEPVVDKDGKAIVDEFGNPRLSAKKTYSDTMLIFMLKGLKPSTYGDRHQIEHSGGIAIQVVTGVPATDAAFTIVEDASKKTLLTHGFKDDASDLC
jgi:hypothetical protein